MNVQQSILTTATIIILVCVSVIGNQHAQISSIRNVTHHAPNTAIPNKTNRAAINKPTRIEELAEQLKQHNSHDSAAKELIKIGTREAIRTVVLDVIFINKESLPDGSQTDRVDFFTEQEELREIKKSGNPNVAKWLLEILNEIPIYPMCEGKTKYSILIPAAEIIGYLSTADNLEAIAKQAQTTQSNELRGLLLTAISSASAPNTSTILKELTQFTEPDWCTSNREKYPYKTYADDIPSIPTAAAIALGRQGTLDAIEFLLNQYTGETDAIVEGLSSIEATNGLGLLFLEQVASGTRLDYQNIDTRTAAITVIGNLNGDNRQMLMQLQKDTNQIISTAATEALNTITERIAIANWAPSRKRQ